jgi:hypothetical protein
VSKARISPERVAGVVALTYLVLIPVGAFVAWQKLQTMDNDLSILWAKAQPDQDPSTNLLGRLLNQMPRKVVTTE